MRTAQRDKYKVKLNDDGVRIIIQREELNIAIHAHANTKLPPSWPPSPPTQVEH